MKLRIRGNTIRLRLGRSEVSTLAEQGAVRESTRFDAAGMQEFGYALESAEVDAISASFEDGLLLVRLPRALVAQWASSDEIAVQRDQSLGSAGALKILIEKDFECLHGAPDDEPQDDAYPHPHMRE